MSLCCFLFLFFIGCDFLLSMIRFVHTFSYNFATSSGRVDNELMEFTEYGM